MYKGTIKMRLVILCLTVLFYETFPSEAMEKENARNGVPKKVMSVSFANDFHGYQADEVYTQAKRLLSQSPRGKDEDELGYLNVVYHLLKEMPDPEERKMLMGSMMKFVKRQTNLVNCLNVFCGLFDIRPGDRVAVCKEVLKSDSWDIVNENPPSQL